jgi:zinc protease
VTKATGACAERPFSTRAIDVRARRAVCFPRGCAAVTRSSFRIALVLLALLLPGVRLADATPSAASAPARLPGEADVIAKTLANGMKIIVWPDHDIPNVVLYNWVHVGSRNERQGITGLSHFFEHMMFNGTSTRAPGEFDRLMEAAGGSNNAFTSEDMTVYQDWFPRSALELIFDLESDRLRNFAFNPQVIESERGVVSSERRSSIDNDTSGSLAEQMQATAFVAHSYQFPVLGWPSDIEAWTLDDLESYFRTYYAPNNCTLVIVGDVRPEEIFALAEKWLGPIPSQPAPPSLRTVEPAQQGERRVTLVRPAQTPLLYFAYKSPTAADPSGPALDMLLDVLIGGEYARLHRLLVEDTQVAISVDGFRQQGLDPGLTWLQIALPAGGDAARVERMLDDALAKVAREGVTDAEIARAKHIVTAAFVRGLATIDGKASALGSFEVLHGDYHTLFAAPAAYDAVTPDDIKRVAASVFNPARRTVGVLVPQKDGDEAQESDEAQEGGDAP